MLLCNCNANCNATIKELTQENSRLTSEIAGLKSDIDSAWRNNGALLRERNAEKKKVERLETVKKAAYRVINAPGERRVDAHGFVLLQELSEALEAANNPKPEEPGNDLAGDFVWP